MKAKYHYDDCPYNCNENGQIVDTTLGKLVPCPHCSERRKELLRKGYAEAEDSTTVSLPSLFGIKNEFLSTKFVYDSVIPEGERIFIEEESMKMQRDSADDLYLSLSAGIVPEHSYCFGISIKGNVEKFVYPMMAKAYAAGLKVSEFITCSEYNLLNYRMDSSLMEFYNADVCFMLLNDGSTLADMSAAKGLMQTRALKGKATIFVSTWTIEACSGLLDFIYESNLSLAMPIFVKYKGQGNKQSSYINNLLGVKNEIIKDGSNVNSASMSDLLN